MLLVNSFLTVLGFVSSASCATNLFTSTTLFSPLIPQKIHKIASTQAQNRYPQYTTANTGKWLYFSPDGWTTGFFPATLYALAERTKICQGEASGQWTEEQWLDLARSWSQAEVPLTASNHQGHDQGFLSFPFIEELKINPTNQAAIKAVNRFASILANRFNPNVGCTRSWDTTDPTDFTVIIDNMMNLELLFVSATLTGNKTLLSIAQEHADATMKNHIRADGSTWHVVEYNSTTGDVIKKRTAQGYSDDSTWSRGQAWGIYGYANIYSHTKNSAYLTTARRLADYFLDHLPPSYIVPWDYNSPEQFSDTSAATIAATALILLAKVEQSQGNKTKWLTAASKLMDATSSLAWAPSWDSLLSNGTVNHPAKNQMTGIVYGDYYYIVAGNELVKEGLTFC
jgi:hypothetical protein